MKPLAYRCNITRLPYFKHIKLHYNAFRLVMRDFLWREHILFVSFCLFRRYLIALSSPYLPFNKLSKGHQWLSFWRMLSVGHRCKIYSYVECCKFSVIHTCDIYGGEYRYASDFSIYLFFIKTRLIYLVFVCVESNDSRI